VTVCAWDETKKRIPAAKQARLREKVKTVISFPDVDESGR
jgi:hypothetical protein